MVNIIQDISPWSKVIQLEAEGNTLHCTKMTRND